MKIIVAGQKVDVGESFQQHVEEKLQASLSKYMDRINVLKVVLSKEGHAFRVDITGNLGTHSGLTLQSRKQASDPYDAFEAAAEKVEKQLRRYKRQITSHHTKHDRDAERLEGVSYVISSEEEEEAAGDNPLIIAEQPTHIERLTVPDAVMRMDLGELPALMFINDSTEQINMIYRRGDGNISWVSQEKMDKATAAA